MCRTSLVPSPPSLRGRASSFQAGQTLRRADAAAASRNAISTSIQRLSIGAGIGGVPPPTTVTGTSASHGGGVLPGAHTVLPEGLTETMLFTFGGGSELKVAVTV